MKARAILQWGIVGLVAAVGYVALGLALELPSEPPASAAPPVAPTATVARAVTFTPLSAITTHSAQPTKAGPASRPATPGGSTPAPAGTFRATPAAGTGANVPTAAAAGVVATPTATAAPITYTVEAGDTMGAISEKFGVSAEAIANANNLSDPDHLAIGQELIIPPK